MQDRDERTRWKWPLAALFCGLVALGCFAFPIYVIRPFRHQGAQELNLALFILRIGPWLSITCAALAIGAAVLAWRRSGARLVRGIAAVAALLAVAGASAARVNVYEIMFHPLGAPQTEMAGEARLDADDMVIGVHVNGQARAYPIREMAYHHVVNDVVSGEPIAATY